MTTVSLQAVNQTWPRQQLALGRREQNATISKAHGYTYQTLLTSLPLVAADLASLLVVTLSTGFAVSFVVDDFLARIVWTAMVLPISVLCVNLLLGSYPGVGQNPIVEFRQSSVAITAIFAVLFATTASGFADGYFFLIAWASSIIMNHVFRSVTRRFAGRTSWWRQPAIVFGDDAVAKRLCASFESRPGLGLRPVGHVDPQMSCAITKAGNRAFEDPSSTSQSVFWAIVAISDEWNEQVARMIVRLRERYPQVLIVTSKSDSPSLWSDTKDCGGTSAMHIVEPLLMPIPQAVKRVLDLALILVGGAMLLPLFFLLGLLVRLGSEGPIFYSQSRIGKGGRHFQAWKFRTMVANADQVLQQRLASDPELRAEWERDHKLKNDPRVTWIGNILRKTSVDELPQLWNVLRGEMSLVGPRPIVDDEIEKYGETYRMYKRVIPGISGLWQVSGRNNTTYAERVGLDAFYVRNWSPWFDLYILLRTVKVVLLRDGAY